MKILVINSGSSSIKYQLFGLPEATVLAKGLVQRIGEPQGKIEQHANGIDLIREEPFENHSVGLRRAMDLLTHGESSPITSPDEISAVGHRVVHGGEHFHDSVRIDDSVIEAIEANIVMAPLHNPPNLQGIRVSQEVLPNAVQVAVFDTAFHQTLPPHAFHYALPQELYEDGIRRYGFHGTSHKYVATRAAEMLNKPLNTLDLITCHLGNGSSMAAIENGRVIDTSMGLTPLEGLVMGTRTGDLDPAIVFHLGRVKGMSPEAVETLLNKKSGLLGLSGASNDVRELLKLEAAGNENAKLALDVFCYRIKKYIGAYLAAIGRLDALIFTAGIGENAPTIRERSTAGLSALGIRVNEAANEAAIGRAADISPKEMTTRVLVVPTDEERLIAMDTYGLSRN